MALVFVYAMDHGAFVETETIDFNLLKTIRSMTSHLEVRSRSFGEWEKAIIDGFSVWREIVKHDGGRMSIDMEKREIRFLGS